MKRMILCAFCAAMACAPVQAATQVRFEIRGHVTVERQFTFRANPSNFPGYCDAQYLPADCVWLETVKVKLFGFDYVSGESTDGVNFTFGGPANSNNDRLIFGSAVYLDAGAYRGIELSYYNTDAQAGVAFDASAGDLRSSDFGTSNNFQIFQVFPTPVPEPSTWAMLILGFSVIGGAMRRRASTATASRTRLTYA